MEKVHTEQNMKLLNKDRINNSIVACWVILVPEQKEKSEILIFNNKEHGK